MKDQFALDLPVMQKKLPLSFVELQISLLISTLISFCFFTPALWAQTNYSGVTSLSLGGTGRAAVRPEESAYLNPATLIHSRGYLVQAAYRDANVKNNGSIYNSSFHVSESQTQSLFPLGVTYLKTRNYHLPVVDRREDLHLTTGGFILANLTVGIDVSYNSLETDNDSDKEWDASIGFLYVLGKNLGLAFTYHDFLNTDFYYLQRKYGIGANYIFKDFLRTYLDIEYQVSDNPDNEARYMFGLEHVYEKMFAARAGLRFDDFGDNNYWTFGLGLLGPKLGFNYGFEKNFSKVSEYSHSFDVRMAF